ncbi:MAG: hypothetical protein ACRDRP_19970 [Pseudonocardiaceae bacterium]
MASRRDLEELEEIATLRAWGRAHGWSTPEVVEAIVDRFGVSRLKAHRLARGWTRPQAIERIRATYRADGWKQPPMLSSQRLCQWEHKPKVRPGEDYLNRLCRVYETRPDQLGYGHDYTPATQPAKGRPADIAVGHAGDPPPLAAYAGGVVPAAPLALTAGELHDAEPDGEDEPSVNYAGHDTQPDCEEAATDRRQFFQAAGVTSVAALVEQTGLASLRLSRELEASNVGPVTLDQLELQVAYLLRRYPRTPSDQMLDATSALREEVTVLLDGKQTLTQRWELYRIAGQLSGLLGHLSLDLGHYPVAYAHLLTAEQLAREVSDYKLLAWVRMSQSTIALWDKDFPMALSYAQDGQRYATGGLRARLAARCEARACARMSGRAGVMDALGRAQRAMPSGPAGDADGDWWVFTPGSLELYTGISLLWLGAPEQAEPHARQAIAWYQAAPAALQDPANQAQAQINLAICMVHQDHPDEGLRLATDALTADRGRTEANLTQAGEFLTALQSRRPNLPAARDFADHLRTIRTP